jgi:hypothetical protein
MKMFIIFNLFLSLSVKATVAPSRGRLFDEATLIVDGEIIEIKNKSPLKMEITLKVENTVKGNIREKEVRVEYSNILDKGHLFKKCVNKLICTDYPKSKHRFYLKKSVDPNTFFLVDEWFGLESLNS